MERGLFPYTKMIVIKKKCPIPKDLQLSKCWGALAPEIVREIAPDYHPIPNIFDTEVYKIGNVIAKVSDEVFFYCTSHDDGKRNMPVVRYGNSISGDVSLR